VVVVVKGVAHLLRCRCTQQPEQHLHLPAGCRYPFGKGALRLMRLLDVHGCCCPSRLLLAAVRLLGYQYAGYEVGHVQQCGYSRAEHEEAYCLRGW
jgi:hypothetical protein